MAVMLFEGEEALRSKKILPISFVVGGELHYPR
jgi:hypothetical protein